VEILCCPQNKGVKVKLMKGILLGIVALSSSQVTAKADDDAASQIRLLKAQLKRLEQRVDEQSQKEAKTRAALAAAPPPEVYRTPSVFDPCPAGKICFKGITLTPGGWIDLAGIYRTRDLASDTGSVYAFIPFRQAKNFNAQESRFWHARPDFRFWRRRISPIRILWAMAKSISRAQRRRRTPSQPTM
jgi:outer membrane murein-binding lipoprotein Lpp